MDKSNKEMSFLGHLDELRRRLFKIAVAVFAIYQGTLEPKDYVLMKFRLKYKVEP